MAEHLPAQRERETEPDGFLFVCRNARGQHRHGGNVAVCWWDDEKSEAEEDDDA